MRFFFRRSTYKMAIEIMRGSQPTVLSLQLRFKVFRLFRIEEAEADRTVAGRRMVVHTVGEDEAKEVAAFGAVIKRPSLVDKPVVNKAVEYSVEGKTQSHKPERCPPQRPCDKQPRRDKGKTHGVEVIFLERPVRMHMVAFVPTPSRAVHVIFMEDPCEDFHEDDAAKGYDDVEDHGDVSLERLRLGRPHHGSCG